MIRVLTASAVIGTVGLLAVVCTALIALKMAEAVGIAPPIGEEEE